MTLLETQQLMAHAILRPLTAFDRIDPQTDAGFIKPNARLTALERLEIYSRSYWSRAMDSLREDFPGLRAVLGRKAFDSVARTYLAEHPSRSWTLRDLGSRLELWLRRNPACAGSCPALALDMARLEWAHIEAFDGGERKPLSLDDLAGFDAETSLAVEPHLSLLEFQYPVDDLLVRIRVADATARRRTSDAVRRARSRPPSRFFVAVYRTENVVCYKRLLPDEFLILGEIRRGKTLGHTIDMGAQRTALAPGEFEGLIESWFASWSRLGWLCLPHEPEKSPAAC